VEGPREFVPSHAASGSSPVTNGQDVFDFQFPNYPLPNLPDSLPLEMPSRICAPVLTQSNFHALFSYPIRSCRHTGAGEGSAPLQPRVANKVVNGWSPVRGNNPCPLSSLAEPNDPERSRREVTLSGGPRPHRRLSHLLPFPAHETSVRARL
jgi:hypothetical protein